MKQDQAPAQKMYDWVMLQAREMMFNDQGIQSIIGKIQSADDPAKGIGHTAAMLMRSVSSGAAEKGSRVSPQVLAAAFKETVGDLTEIAVAAKLVPEEAKAQVAASAIQQGAAFFKKPATPEQAPQGAPQAPGIVQSAMGA